jgi:integrase-like protein
MVFPVFVTHLVTHRGLALATWVAGTNATCHPDGRAVHPDTVTERFNRLVDRAGFKRIRLHDVRHTYATTSLDSGIDPKIVADRIGDANMAYTLTIYTHPARTGKDRNAAETVVAVPLGPGGSARSAVPPTSARFPMTVCARRARCGAKMVSSDRVCR